MESEDGDKYQLLYPLQFPEDYPFTSIFELNFPSLNRPPYRTPLGIPGTMMGHQNHHHQDHQSKVLYELSALVLNIIRSPPTAAPRRRWDALSFQSMTPAGFASLLLGISLSLMLCGSVTFFLGFMLMPWVLGLVVFLYFVGIVSSISMIGRAILCHNPAPPSPTKEIPYSIFRLS
ncbi:uncharacterized protein LOC125216151 isoform X2 [Salvia hispanica]|uniref:uncharacterized protein LOC125216151 isoform X2 n=1 Tax=Salvia hispanica TaxID=49212 RepID=UPI002009BD93|nr:uncharacterized protein LOC125216151 isoform X2 [Salvia hispanica]